jgi:hypothetical protein
MPVMTNWTADRPTASGYYWLAIWITRPAPGWDVSHVRVDLDGIRPRVYWHGTGNDWHLDGVPAGWLWQRADDPPEPPEATPDDPR